MGGDEHMNKEPELRDSLDKEKKLEDGLKLNVVTEEVRGGVLAENGCLSLEDGSPKRSTEIVGTLSPSFKKRRVRLGGAEYERKRTRNGDVAH
ncbi:hypothetical protein LR48_Vigan09g000600 [Vigna angularis]|uniref:Uncharacterized protein n=1 Tax=Phaseolus angularis TaxID=3914 RepID=A0A0L9V8W7_PHAAN|nr:hypothetical protein LR48_Vigan09g000600 [Vigna angularis]